MSMILWWCCVTHSWMIWPLHTPGDSVHRWGRSGRVKIKCNNMGGLSMTVYCKSTHTDQYLNFASNQPLLHKLAIIRTLLHHCQSICSEDEAKLQENEHLKKVLSISGYTRSAQDTATKLCSHCASGSKYHHGERQHHFALCKPNVRHHQLHYQESWSLSTSKTIQYHQEPLIAP